MMMEEEEEEGQEEKEEEVLPPQQVGETKLSSDLQGVADGEKENLIVLYSFFFRHPELLRCLLLFFFIHPAIHPSCVEGEGG